MDNSQRDEEAIFEVWFQLHRLKRWRLNNSDRGKTPTEAFMMGQRPDLWEGWLARAGLRITYGKGAP